MPGLVTHREWPRPAAVCFQQLACTPEYSVPLNRRRVWVCDRNQQDHHRRNHIQSRAPTPSSLKCVVIDRGINNWLLLHFLTTNRHTKTFIVYKERIQLPIVNNEGNPNRIGSLPCPFPRLEWLIIDEPFRGQPIAGHIVHQSSIAFAQSGESIDIFENPSRTIRREGTG